MFADEHEFEDEIRRIARLLWPSAQYGGSTIEDGRERDGVFQSEEFVHLIECTVSRSKQKAEEDSEKLQKLARKYGARFPRKFIKGWFVTLNEPTADQRSVFSKVQGRIVPVSFDQFRSRLIDARSYLNARDDYPFGSVRDPETGVAKFKLEYVPLDILDAAGALHDIKLLSQTVEQGERFVLLGDFGAGKSTTMREVYFRLESRFRSNEIRRFPLLLNLPDHHGQTDPVEALERHARRVGFSPPESLVRGWRAGLVTLLLDGFDEVATAGWAGKTKRLRDLRHRSMELVRAFLRDTPGSTGVILAGRAHFFDSQQEMAGALSLGPKFQILNLNEFSEKQVVEYLRRTGWTEAVPGWIPSRPLLLGYLASRGLLKETLEIEKGSSAAAGWDALLERICAREAEIEAGIDADTVRQLIEYIATLARSSVDGLGPVSPDEITAAFSAVCGYPPDDRGVVLLQRLPGLGGYSAQDGSRVFIDQDFSSAAQGGAVFSFISNPFRQTIETEGWQSALLPLGVQVAAHRGTKAGYSGTKVGAALKHAADSGASFSLAADVLLVLNELDASYVESSVFIKEVLIPELKFESDSADHHTIELQDSVIGRLEVASEVDQSYLPRFVRCYFGVVEGRTGPKDLPAERFVECAVGAYEDSVQTTAAILELPLPLGTKVVLTILKKLYAQAGAGRRESALYRGLDVRARERVPDALSLLRREGFAARSRQGGHVVWVPGKSSELRKRALSILAGPSASRDPLVVASSNLS